SIYNYNMLTVPNFSANEGSQITPKTAHLDLLTTARGNRGMVDDPYFSARFLPTHSKYHIDCIVRRRATARDIILNQIYFQGWCVRVDGREIPDSELVEDCKPEGLLKVRLPDDSNEHAIEAWYDGPPGWRILLIFCMLFIAVLLFGAKRLLNSNI